MSRQETVLAGLALGFLWSFLVLIATYLYLDDAAGPYNNCLRDEVRLEARGYKPICVPSWELSSEIRNRTLTEEAE